MFQFQQRKCYLLFVRLQYTDKNKTQIDFSSRFLNIQHTQERNWEYSISSGSIFNTILILILISARHSPSKNLWKVLINGENKYFVVSICLYVTELRGREALTIAYFFQLSFLNTSRQEGVGFWKDMFDVFVHFCPQTEDWRGNGKKLQTEVEKSLLKIAIERRIILDWHFLLLMDLFLLEKDLEEIIAVTAMEALSPSWSCFFLPPNNFSREEADKKIIWLTIAYHQLVSNLVKVDHWWADYNCAKFFIFLKRICLHIFS